MMEVVVPHPISNGEDATGMGMEMEMEMALGGFRIPVVLMVGSSMSSGKTTTACAIIHELRRRGKKVLAAKLCGAGYYRDSLAMADSGTSHTAIIPSPSPSLSLSMAAMNI